MTSRPLDLIRMDCWPKGPSP